MIERDRIHVGEGEEFEPLRTPTPKVAAAGLAGAVTTLIVFLVGPDVAPEVAAAIATVVSFAAGYLRG